MSGLREALIDALTEIIQEAHGRNAVLTKSRQQATLAADAVLRVLAEHGDLGQVREELVSSGALILPRGDRIGAVMAVVVRIVAARDAAVERWRYWTDLAVELRADLADVRQQLDRAEAIVDLVRKVGRGTITPAELTALLAESDAAINNPLDEANEGHWTCGRCGGTSQTHAAGGSNQECLYEPTLESQVRQ